MLIIDPDMNGCTIWNTSTNKVRTFKGDINPICEFIFGMVSHYRDGCSTTQTQDILLDCSGIGNVYYKILSKCKLKINIAKKIT